MTHFFCLWMSGYMLVYVHKQCLLFWEWYFCPILLQRFVLKKELEVPFIYIYISFIYLLGVLKAL